MTSVAPKGLTTRPETRRFEGYGLQPRIAAFARTRAGGDNKDVKTLRLFVDPNNLESPDAQRALGQASELLRSGGTVALPTETVYGLGANALDAAAVAKIFDAKQRPAWDPIIVHIADEAMITGVVTEISEAARSLMAAFWPGPLTLLLPRSAAVPDIVTAGRPLVGVRMPAHPVAFELIRRAGVPVAAPSANLFGHTSPTTAAHVLEDLDGRIDAVLDAGPTAHGVESTVLDPNRSPMVLYRPGAISAEQIRAVAGAVEVFRDSGPQRDGNRQALPSPGLGLRHYAPRARLVLVGGSFDGLGRLIAEAAHEFRDQRVGVMLPDGVDCPRLPKRARIYRWGSWSAPEEMAAKLYAGLRDLDARQCTAILCPVPPGDGIGAAIRDRLIKAAS
jgi:L-threonylcarbamoyladenylate synthase